MTKLNCWEFKKCGRDRNGDRPVCPAVVETRADGVNEGENAGRVCWSVEGTFCHGGVQGNYAQKLPACLVCDFRLKVHQEMGPSFRLTYF